MRKLWCLLSLTEMDKVFSTVWKVYIIIAPMFSTQVYKSVKAWEQFGSQLCKLSTLWLKEEIQQNFMPVRG